MTKDKREGYTISKPTIADNGQGATISILPGEYLDSPIAVILIKQYEKWIEGDKIKKGSRCGYLKGEIDGMAAIGWEPGSITGGRCCIVDSVEPPDESDPLQFLSYSNKKLRRYKGSPVYRISYYSFSVNEQDTILPDDPV